MGNSNELKNNLDQATNMDEVQDEKKLTDDEVSEVAGGEKVEDKKLGIEPRSDLKGWENNPLYHHHPPNYTVFSEPAENTLP